MARTSPEPARSFGPLARELLAAMREGREYLASRCADQPVWRLELASCRAALEELVDAGIAERVVGEVFRQTAAGEHYYTEAEAIMDARLYRSWHVLTESRYEEYLQALGALEETTPGP